MEPTEPTVPSSERAVALANDAQPLTLAPIDKVNKGVNAETTYLDVVKRAVAMCSKSLEDGKKKLEKAQKKGRLPATQTKLSKIIEVSEKALDYWSRELAAVEPFFK